MTAHQAGDVIGGRYAVSAYLAEGGMQEVYEAHDRLLDRRVALKTPKTDSAARRFERSARTSAKINQANVAKTLDYLTYGHRQYLVEELITGCDLRVFLRDEVSRLDPYMCAHVLHHLAKGLAASHHAGVVHRDLKPSNIMVVGGGEFFGVKITDFGIAKMAEMELAVVAGADEEAVTQSATALGALPYMAPEMIVSIKDAGHPADVWSLGAMVFELLIGFRPFGSGYAAVPAIQAAIVPPIPQEYLSKIQFANLTVEVYEIIRGCLVRNADDRLRADDIVRRCEDLCYRVAPREFGTIGYMPHPNHGFITRDGLPDVHFHQDSVTEGRISQGQRVWFSKDPGSPRERAFPVVPARPK